MNITALAAKIAALSGEERSACLAIADALASVGVKPKRRGRPKGSRNKPRGRRGRRSKVTAADLEAA